MEVTQVGINYINMPVFFTKGKEGVTKIEILDDGAVVHIKDKSEFVITKEYLIGHVKGEPVVLTEDFEEPKKNKRHKKVVRR